MRRAGNSSRRRINGSASATPRIVLLDDTGVRARMAGAWLRQMGHRDVFVVEGGLEEVRDSGTALAPIPELAAPAPCIDVAGLVALREAGEDVTVVDIGRSIDFREGHIPGALWGVRTRLDALAPKLEQARRIVVTSADGSLALLAVPELAGLAKSGSVLALQGGTAAWRAAGQQLVADQANPPNSACVDFYLRPYDRNSGVAEAMRAYLDWEIDLVREIAKDGTVRFGVDAVS